MFSSTQNAGLIILKAALCYPVGKGTVNCLSTSALQNELLKTFETASMSSCIFSNFSYIIRVDFDVNPIFVN